MGDICSGSGVVKLARPTYFHRLGMSPFFHALNTGTLAAWLSVAGFGAVGVLLPDDWDAPEPQVAKEIVTEAEWIEPEILLGEADPAPVPPPADAPPPEELPAPPELAESPPLEPLPEIPDLPPPVAPPTTRAVNPIASQPRSQPQRKPTARPATATGAPRSANPGSPTGGEMSNAARLAAGRMPSPSYPAEARSKGQTGTVTVEFTVDTSGRVIAAYAKTPSPWPLLNEEAVRTVRRWRFPPGGIMKLQRPIIFQLR